MPHQTFAATTRGLERDLPPMRLNEKAKDASLDKNNRIANETEEL